MLGPNIQGEQCAIGVYDKLMNLTAGKDPVTYNMALQILEQEVEHEEDLQALLEDLDQVLTPPEELKTRKWLNRGRRIRPL